MKRILTTLLALALTALLFLAAPWRIREAAPLQRRDILRVWIAGEDAATISWLKKQAAAYEQETKCRVYLRRAEEEETLSALSRAPDAVIPDVIVGAGERPVALRGYALILRDDAAREPTPRPTSALFARPTPAPGPTPEPPALPPWEQVGAVLCPAVLRGAVPGTVLSDTPAADLAAGKADAALLTAGEANQLKIGFRAYPIPDGRGLIPIRAAALTAAGEQFLSALLSDQAQAALGQHGLYALSARLYTSNDPIRFLIDGSRAGN